ncbi:DMT family transporter [Burkholderia sp. F1]|uniref:DMT family transporter n=1 Tax=Burkholderia sp. F1 TaxID=3366817 RepID=UPI003D765740
MNALRIRYACAVWLMALATKRLEMGLACAIWAGASTAATVVTGIVCFGESASPIKLAGVALAVCGIVALNPGDGSH